MTAIEHTINLHMLQKRWGGHLHSTKQPTIGWGGHAKN